MIDWQIIFLGILQGITEFLPISSSGHLLILEKFLKINQNSLLVILILHGATLLSILCFFWKDLRAFFLNLNKLEQKQLFQKICLSLSPLIIIAIFSKYLTEQSFHKPILVLGFLSSGLLFLSLFFVKRQKLTLACMTYKQALYIGIAQAVAVLPGFSRSGWTIAIALYCGLAPRSAVYYSFLIAIPTIIAALMMHAFFPNSQPQPAIDIASLSLAGILAFLVGLTSLASILKLVQKDKLQYFAFYLIPLSAIVFFFL